MIIPLTLGSDDGKVKLFSDGRYRNIKSIDFLSCSIAVSHCVNGRLKQLCAVFLGILGCSREQVENILRNKADVQRHFAAIYSKCSKAFACFIGMEHTAVCCENSTVSAVLKYICGSLCSCFRRRLCLGSFCCCLCLRRRCAA